MKSLNRVRNRLDSMRRITIRRDISTFLCRIERDTRLRVILLKVVK